MTKKCCITLDLNHCLCFSLTWTHYELNAFYAYAIGAWNVFSFVHYDFLYIRLAERECADRETSTTTTAAAATKGTNIQMSNMHGPIRRGDVNEVWSCIL